MPRFTTTRLIIASPLIAALAACGGESADTPEPTAEAPAEIAERQDNFEGIGDSFKVIRDQLEGGEPDFALIEASAADINSRLQRVLELFPEGSSMEAGYDTEALAVIWEDPEGFAEVSQTAISLSEEFMAAAATGDAEAVGAQVGNLGLNGCKACHDKYRVDDD